MTRSALAGTYEEVLPGPKHPHWGCNNCGDPDGLQMGTWCFTDETQHCVGKGGHTHWDFCELKESSPSTPAQSSVRGASLVCCVRTGGSGRRGLVWLAWVVAVHAFGSLFASPLARLCFAFASLLPRFCLVMCVLCVCSLCVISVCDLCVYRA